MLDRAGPFVWHKIVPVSHNLQSTTLVNIIVHNWLKEFAVNIIITGYIHSVISMLYYVTNRKIPCVCSGGMTQRFFSLTSDTTPSSSWLIITHHVSRRSSIYRNSRMRIGSLVLLSLVFKIVLTQMKTTMVYITVRQKKGKLKLQRKQKYPDVHFFLDGFPSIADSDCGLICTTCLVGEIQTSNFGIKLSFIDSCNSYRINTISDTIPLIISRTF